MNNAATAFFIGLWAIMVLLTPVTIAVAVTLLIVFGCILLMTCQEMFFMFRYRHEYMACINAIHSNSEEQVDAVNKTTRHYFVRKDFSFTGGKSINARYRYSIDNYVRRRPV